MKLCTFLPAFAFLAAGLQAAPPDAPATPPDKPAHGTASRSEKNPALFAPAKNPKNPEGVIPEVPNPWRVTGGAQWRQIGALHFSGAASAPAFTLPGPVTAHPLMVGDPTVLGNRIYSDGYNKLDHLGGVNTTNFGYNNASQLGGGESPTLAMHATGTNVFLRESAKGFDTNWSDDPAGFGAFVKLESPQIYRSGDFSFSAEFNYSFTHGSSGNTVDAFQATQHSDVRTTNVTDIYTQNGSFPPAPYAGTFAGPGATISNLPTSRTTTSSDLYGRALFSSMLSSHLNTNLHTFSFGADAHEELSWARFGLSGGLALNVASWDGSTFESLRNNSTGATVQNWTFHQSGNNLVPGFYLEASASVPITERWSFFTSGRYDWAGSLHGNVAGSSFDIALGGWTLAGGFTLKF